MTDGELVLSARGGDKAAEEEILKKYTPYAKKIAARFFLYGGETEDLVQEGMVGLYSAINNFTSGGNFSSYAYACIRNAVIDAIKKSGGAKYSALNNFVPIVEISDEVSPVVSPEDEVILLENRREFLQKISKNLSSMEFKVIVMYVDGMGVGEISSALEKPQKSVSNALSRAKQKLIKLYS